MRSVIMGNAIIYHTKRFLMLSIFLTITASMIISAAPINMAWSQAPPREYENPVHLSDVCSGPILNNTEIKYARVAPNATIEADFASCKITQKYNQLLARGVDVGEPTSNVTAAKRNDSFYQNFSNGVIYTSPATGTIFDTTLTHRYLIMIDRVIAVNPRSTFSDSDGAELSGQILGQPNSLNQVSQYIGGLGQNARIPLIDVPLGPFELILGSDEPLRYNFIIYNYGGSAWDVLLTNLQETGISWLRSNSTDAKSDNFVVNTLQNALPLAGGCDGPVAIFQTDLQPEDLYLRTNGAEGDSEEERYFFGANESPWVKDHPWYCRDSSYLAYVKYRPIQ
jgi:hypothetical protein